MPQALKSRPLSLGGILLSLMLGLSPLSAQATPSHSSLVPEQFQKQDDFEEFPPTRGTGTRPGKCGEESIRGEIFPLTPESNILTTADPNPSLYFYLPAIKNKEATFWVLDDTDEIIYDVNLTLSNNAGILQVELPEELTLTPDTRYKWGFAVHCDPRNLEIDETDEAVTGWLTRTDLEPPTNTEPLQQVEYYRQENVWQEAFEILLQQRERQPQAWADLLESEGLEDYIDAPMID
ncbi:MAG: DUF928 domain-containing protein [Kamptonema sp. SIO4C4]|nr:DUF928 domain-containing protein [Kamptonema sp. SIO4C4]